MRKMFVKFLITKLNVLPDEVAVKSSEKDEIEDINLLSPDCPIRYIITKQALQEGWDCPFAYIVTILTNPESTTGITQLIGRVLRQPYAFKTGIPDLDESHVYCYRIKTRKLLDEIRAGMNDEGLGDLAGRVIADVETSRSEIEVSVREQFKEYAGKVYLPYFVVLDGPGEWREAGYETDVLQFVDWNRIDLSRFDSIELNPTSTGDAVTKIGLDHAFDIEAIKVTPSADMQLDASLLPGKFLIPSLIPGLHLIL